MNEKKGGGHKKGKNRTKKKKKRLNEEIDGGVQHYRKCLYFVSALRIVLHSPIDMVFT